tara:strand:- start:3242 stop:3451 length:210 start_codon:yes stop_codon:yes gene_type:complete
MAIKCKVFLHDAKNLASSDGDDDGKLAEDIQDYVTANISSTLAGANLNVTSTMIEGGSRVMTLVICDNS